jgi:hypothetical protein
MMHRALHVTALAAFAVFVALAVLPSGGGRAAPPASLYHLSPSMNCWKHNGSFAPKPALVRKHLAFYLGQPSPHPASLIAARGATILPIVFEPAGDGLPTILGVYFFDTVLHAEAFSETPAIKNTYGSSHLLERRRNVLFLWDSPGTKRYDEIAVSCLRGSDAASNSATQKPYRATPTVVCLRHQPDFTAKLNIGNRPFAFQVFGPTRKAGFTFVEIAFEPAATFFTKVGVYFFDNDQLEQSFYTSRAREVRAVGQPSRIDLARNVVLLWDVPRTKQYDKIARGCLKS